VALVCLIIVATIVQIVHNAPDVPEIQLSENATQVLIAAIGGIIGVLGGYFGIRLHNYKSPKENYMIEDPTPPGQGAPPPTQPTSPPDTSPPEPQPDPEPTENDDKTDVQPRPEPKEEGDPHGSPLDDEEDRQYLRSDDPEGA
jgi:outer membrane biosynthesis protein TonB